MKAIVYQNARSPDILKLEDIDTPTPGDDEVLLKVRAAALNPIDSHLLKHPFLRRMLSAQSKKKSTGPGRDVAGEVEAVGRNVTQFKPGDAIFGLCGGSCAEYACASESALVMKPENVSFEQAASLPLAGLTALQGLRDKGKIQAGQKVLINGAAGGVGTFAVQVAKSFGVEVAGVCGTRNIEMVRSIGADHVFDYTREDFTKSGQYYDLIFDLAANHSFSARMRVLSRKGICVMVGMVGLSGSAIHLVTRLITDLVFSRFVSQKVVNFMAKISKEDLVILRDLMEAGKITPVIDRSYSLSEVPEAIRYLDRGHARGKVVITF